MTLKIQCDSEVAKAFDQPGSRRLVARLLATGMNEDALMNRLFAEAIAGGEFPEAEHIIWDIAVCHDSDGVTVTATSSAYWLNALRETKQYHWSGPAPQQGMPV